MTLYNKKASKEGKIIVTGIGLPGE